jgi:hypothetical protein
MMRACLTLLILVPGLLAATGASADLSKGSLFASEAALEVEIRAPWRKLTREKEEKPWPASLTVTGSQGETLSVDLTVERRGITRQRICDFPPIRLRFDKNSVDGTLFDGEGSLKLVTHCDRGDRWTQYYVTEMLAYRIYRLISDYSFRVRPLRVRYFDVDREKGDEEQFAFVIEDVDEVADRHDLDELELPSTRPERLEPRAASQMALFQFMIGNLDWSALRGPDQSCCHNTKLIGSDAEDEAIIPIPYDFDVSGFVDAHYAMPPDKLPVRSVRTRLYRGYCIHNPTLLEARAQFLALQADILGVVSNEPRLDERNRRQSLDYLASFFEILGDDTAFDAAVLSECRN